MSRPDLAVVISFGVQESIYLVQSILRPGGRAYSDDLRCKELCCRPLQHMLKMDMELNKNPESYDRATRKNSRAGDLIVCLFFFKKKHRDSKGVRGRCVGEYCAESHLRLDSIELRSSIVPLTSGGYAVAIPSEGTLYLLPINVVVQLRPSLKHVDDAVESMRVEAQLSEQEPDEGRLMIRSTLQDRPSSSNVFRTGTGFMYRFCKRRWRIASGPGSSSET